MSKPEYLREGFDFCLAHLVEECGEVIAAAGKTQRWGRESYNPEPGASKETNEEWLLREIKDMEDCISRIRVEIVKPKIRKIIEDIG